jgi:hypothetical protein
MTHRYWTLGLLAVVAGGLIARPAVATDQDTFNKLIAKVATTVVFGQKLIPKRPVRVTMAASTRGKRDSSKPSGSEGPLSAGSPASTPPEPCRSWGSAIRSKYSDADGGYGAV